VVWGYVTIIDWRGEELKIQAPIGFTHRPVMVGGLSVVQFSFEAPNAQVRALHNTKFIRSSSHDMKFEQFLNDWQGRDWLCEGNVCIVLAK
jgi:hypothetical protein